MSALSERLADAKGTDSIDKIADRATEQGHPIDRSTVDRYVRGKGAKTPPDDVLAALASGLDLDVRELRILAGLPPGELDPYDIPAEVNRLNRDQRDALTLLIKAIAAGSEEIRHVAKPAQKTNVIEGSFKTSAELEDIASRDED